jgi:hypothetical protein
MNGRGKFVTIALSALAVLGLSSLSASARIACNNDGVCWHVHEDWAFPPGAGVVIHPDDWRWKDNEHYSWREHAGRGFWNGDRWQVF